MTTDPNSEDWELLSQISQDYRTLSDNFMDRIGMHRAQATLLGRLYVNNGMTQSELADQCVVRRNFHQYLATYGKSRFCRAPTRRGRPPTGARRRKVVLSIKHRTTLKGQMIRSLISTVRINAFSQYLIFSSGEYIGFRKSFRSFSNENNGDV